MYPYEEMDAHIPAGDVFLRGDLIIPRDPRGLVVFAHGSGSSRFSTRNRHVAAELRAYGLGTLLTDLLTPAEEAVDETSAHIRFDIALLSDRVVHLLEWVAGRHVTEALPIGLFGGSTGAAAALVAAARCPHLVDAVVSRGGRPDLAAAALPAVLAPTLLIVGGHDLTVLELNRQARALMKAPTEVVVVPGATHLFEEPGALDAVANHAAAWFSRYLSTTLSTSPSRKEPWRPMRPRTRRSEDQPESTPR